MVKRIPEWMQYAVGIGALTIAMASVPKIEGYIARAQAQRRAQLEAIAEPERQKALEDYGIERAEKDREDFIRKLNEEIRRSLGETTGVSNSTTYQGKIEGIRAVFGKYALNSPLTPEMVVSACDKYKIPYDQCLTGLIVEGHLGTRGRAVKTRNPGNVGNIDNGKNRHFTSEQQGLKDYCALLARAYDTNLDDFIKNDFQRKDGTGRYMTSDDAKRNYVSVGKRVRGILSGDS